MLALEITVDAAAVEARIGGVASRAADLTAPFTAIGESVLSDARMDIESSKGSLFEAAWTPMSGFTVWFHQRDASDLLHWTGGLDASLARGGPENIFEVGPTAGVFGTAQRVAGWQQRGTSRTFHVLQFRASHGRIREWHEPGIPARPFLAWHEERIPEYLKILTDHVSGVEA